MNTLADPIPVVTNDPDPLLIAVYGVGFLIAIVWNLYAYYKLFHLGAREARDSAPTRAR